MTETLLDGLTVAPVVQAWVTHCMKDLLTVLSVAFPGGLIIAFMFRLRS